MFNKLKLFIFELYLSYLARYNRKSLEKELDKALDFSYNASEYNDIQTQDKLYQGILRLKRKINDKVLSGSNYDTVLTELKDLVSLTTEDYNVNKIKAILYSMHVKSGSDVKSSKDKIQMIEDRVNHYYELQRFNEEKVLLRKIRAAKRLGDKELESTLLKQWKEEYGKQSRGH